MKPFIERVWKRRVAQWVVAYLAGAFVVLQLFDALETPLGLTPTIGREILVLLGAGLAVTVTVAWYHGEQGRQKVAGMEVVILVAVLALTGSVLTMLRSSVPEVPKSPPFSRVASTDTASIAVLRFRDLGGSDDDGLADAIHDEIITHLTMVPGLNRRVHIPFPGSLVLAAPVSADRGSVQPDVRAGSGPAVGAPRPPSPRPPRTFRADPRLRRCSAGWGCFDLDVAAAAGAWWVDLAGANHRGIPCLSEPRRGGPPGPTAAVVE